MGVVIWSFGYAIVKHKKNKMKLKVKINKIKSVNFLEIDLPIQKGLYAITGQNGSGKSTIVTCAATVFFSIPMNEYFGRTEEDSSIEFELGDTKRGWSKVSGKWQKTYQGNMEIKGFYEGSVIFGNRFRNTNFDLLKKLDKINDNALSPADEFIRENLGLILHNNKNHYEKLYSLTAQDAEKNINPRGIGLNEIAFRGEIFYYQKGIKRVSQFHMSTGENLLVSVLSSINKRNKDRASLNKPCLMFLDEIELALHPSSLKRLIAFLKNMSNKYNYATYFSTHSIELISGIIPENIFFINRHFDDSIEVLNPCYPAYATRILYDYHMGYDFIILVEDDLAKEIIYRLLKKYSLFTNTLIHILPCGGYTNVIDLAQEVVNSNLVSKPSSIFIVLDGDVELDAKAYIEKNNISNNIPLNFLPIESLEKYLKSNLVDNVDHKLFRILNDNVFHQVSLNQIVTDYRSSGAHDNDRNGKKLYGRIDSELRARNKSRSEIVEMIVDYLINNQDSKVDKIVSFIRDILNK